MKTTFLIALIIGATQLLEAQKNNIDRPGLQTVETLIRRGTPNEAIVRIDSMFPLLEGTDKMNLLLLRYLAQRNASDMKGADSTVIDLSSQLASGLLPSQAIAVLVANAEINALLGRWALSRKYADLVRRRFNELSDTAVVAGRLAFAQGLTFSGEQKLYDKSRAAFDRAISLLSVHPDGDVHLLGSLLRNRGNSKRQAGDLTASINYYQRELELYQDYYPADHQDIAFAHYHLGGVFYEMLAYQEALSHFLKAYEHWDENHPRSARFKRYLTDATADMYWEVGDRPNALRFYDMAVSGLPANEDQGKRLATQADQLLAKGEENAALQIYQRALRFREDNLGPNHPLTAACQNFVAAAHRKAGRLDTALLAYQSTLIRLSDTMNPYSLANNPPDSLRLPSYHFIVEALAGKGSLLLERAMTTSDLDDLAAAAETLDLAVEYQETALSGAISDASKVFWNSHGKELLEEAIHAHLLLFDITEDSTHLSTAFSLSEKSRALLLMSQLQESKSATFAGVPTVLQDEERYLRSALREYAQKIVSEEKRCAEASAQRLELWREKHQQLLLRWEELRSELKRDYPGYFSLRHQLAKTTTVQLQQGLLREKTALLAYFVGQQYCFSFYLDGHTIQARTQEVADLPHDALKRLLKLTSDRKAFWEKPAKAYQEYTTAAFTVYQSFFGPLKDNNTTANLIIIPDGILTRVPFAALLTASAPEGERSYTTLPYLIRQQTLSYAPSAGYWLQTQLGAAKFNKRSLPYAGFAPEFMDGDPFLGELPHAVEEVRAAKKCLGGTSFIGAEATEANFRSRSPKVLHLAAHAVEEPEEPLDSRIVLFPGDVAEDGLVHAYEIYGLQMEGQLVVLSACHGATGEFVPGEGVMSLERAFQYAGYPAVFSSIWAADDGAAAKLLGHFFRLLATGRSKAEALQEAQLEYLTEADPAHANPFFWAGFRLAGNTRPLHLSRWSNGWWLLLVPAAIGIYGFIRFKSSRASRRL